MADKPNLNIFTNTSGKPDDQLKAIDLNAAPTVSTGLGIRKGEKDALDMLAKRYKVSFNKLLRLFIRYCLVEIREGRLDMARFVVVPPEPDNDINLPE